MKVNSKIYKGIEYIQLTDLPKEQQDLIVQDLNEDFFIKILVEKNIVSNCIQYKDYEFWFENVYRVKESSQSIEVPVKVRILDTVLGKA